MKERKLTKSEIEALIAHPEQATPGMLARIELSNTELHEPALLLLIDAFGGVAQPITNKQRFDVQGLLGMTSIDGLTLGLAARIAQKVGKFRIEIYVKQEKEHDGTTH